MNDLIKATLLKDKHYAEVAELPSIFFKAYLCRLMEEYCKEHKIDIHEMIDEIRLAFL